MVGLLELPGPNGTAKELLNFLVGMVELLKSLEEMKEHLECFVMEQPLDCLDEMEDLPACLETGQHQGCLDWWGGHLVNCDRELHVLDLHPRELGVEDGAEVERARATLGP